jgi:hypothetical protein
MFLAVSLAAFAEEGGSSIAPSAFLLVFEAEFSVVRGWLADLPLQHAAGGGGHEPGAELGS